MLRDKFFLWPYAKDSLRTAAEEMHGCLRGTDMNKYLDGQPNLPLHTGGLHEFIALECRTWNVNPWWLMICAQREQSLFNGEKLSTSAALAWLGVTGANTRVDLPGYYGIYTQVSRACEITAWLLGIEPSEKWPQYWRTRKETPRWQPGRTVARYGQIIAPMSAGDYMQLQYTMGNERDPYQKVLDTNETLMKKYVPTMYW